MKIHWRALKGQQDVPFLVLDLVLLLLITGIASLLLFGWRFDWLFSVVLVAVLLLHELGHLVAMRWAGYRDLKIFFIPFIGAMVSGREQQATAGQKMLVLLAGPVPGIVLGWVGDTSDAADALIAWRYEPAARATRRVPGCQPMVKLAASKCCSVPPSPTITARRFHELPSRSSLLWKKSERPSKLHGVHSQKNWVKLPSGGGCGSLAPTGRTPQLRSRVPLQLSSTAIRSPSTDSQPDQRPFCVIRV